MYISVLYNQSTLSDITNLIQTDTAKQPKLDLSTFDIDFGTGTNTWYLYAEDATKLKIAEGADNYSYAGTMTPSFTSASAGVMGFWPGDITHRTSMFYLYHDGSNGKGGLVGHSNDTWNSTHFSWTSNTTYNFAMSIDNTNSSNVTFFKNGDNGDTRATNNGASNLNLLPTEFYVGTFNTGTGNKFGGKMDNIVILNKSLIDILSILSALIFDPWSTSFIFLFKT